MSLDTKELKLLKEEMAREIARKPLPEVDSVRKLGDVDGNLAVVLDGEDGTRLAVRRRGRWYLTARLYLEATPQDT